MTDWLRGLVYIYKNNVLERKCVNKKAFRRTRDLVLDNLGNILVTDMERHSFHILDNKGNYLFETKVPKQKGAAAAARYEKGIYGCVLVPNSNKLVFASNCSVYAIDLAA